MDGRSTRQIAGLGFAWLRITWPFFVALAVIGGYAVVDAANALGCDDRGRAEIATFRAAGDPVFRADALGVRWSTGCLTEIEYRGGASVVYEIPRTRPSAFLLWMAGAGWSVRWHAREALSPDGTTVAHRTRQGYPNGSVHFLVVLEAAEG